MSPLSPWGDIFTDQLRGDIFIDQQQTSPTALDRPAATRYSVRPIREGGEPARDSGGEGGMPATHGEGRKMVTVIHYATAAAVAWLVPRWAGQKSRNSVDRA